VWEISLPDSDDQRRAICTAAGAGDEVGTGSIDGNDETRVFVRLTVVAVVNSIGRQEEDVATPHQCFLHLLQLLERFLGQSHAPTSKAGPDNRPG